MTIRKGEPWGSPAALPADGLVVATDRDASSAAAEADRAGHPPAVIGLAGGDLCRTLGGRGDVARMRSEEAATFPVDVGWVEVDGESHCFVAHTVARSRLWTTALVAMNAQWMGEWNVAPRGHPNDGLLDLFEARLRVSDLRKVRSRLGAGVYLPHPRIAQRRVAAADVTLPRPLPVWVDGARVTDRALHLRFTVRPDALQVVI